MIISFKSLLLSCLGPCSLNVVSNGLFVFSAALSKCSSVLKHSGHPSSSMLGLALELQTDPMEGRSCRNLQYPLSVGANEVSSLILAVDE